MRFLIDGYNLLHALGKLTPRTAPSGHEAARRWLLAQARAAHGADGAVVVFDGHPARGEGDGAGRAVFSRQASADDLIEERVASEAAPARLTVVSDDRRLREAARHRGCPWLGCLDYYERWLLGHRPAAVPAPALPEKPAHGIMEDWAEVFGDIDDDPLLR